MDRFFLILLTFILCDAAIGGQSAEDALLGSLESNKETESPGEDEIADDIAKDGDPNVKVHRGPVFLFDLWSKFRDVTVDWSNLKKQSENGMGFKGDPKNSSSRGNSNSSGKSGGQSDSADSSASAGDDSANKDSERPLERGAAGTGTSPAGASGEVLPRWWPMCVFVDSHVSEEKANRAVKGMVDMAKKCGVYVKIFTRTVRPGTWRDDHDSINRQQVKACNATEGLNVPAASTTALVDPSWPYTAAKMCDSYLYPRGKPRIPNENVAGCAQLRGGTNLNEDQKKHMGKDPIKHSIDVASGGVAPSIEVAKGHDAKTVSHEALGHSQFGKPNGSVHGNAIGEDDERGMQKAGGSGWTATGCQEMYAKAFPNDRKFVYKANRQVYYKRARHPMQQYDMTQAKPLFPRRSLASGQSTPQAAGKQRALRKASDSGEARREASIPDSHKKATPPPVTSGADKKSGSPLAENKSSPVVQVTSIVAVKPAPVSSSGSVGSGKDPGALTPEFFSKIVKRYLPGRGNEVGNPVGSASSASSGSGFSMRVTPDSSQGGGSSSSDGKGSTSLKGEKGGPSARELSSTALADQGRATPLGDEENGDFKWSGWSSEKAENSKQPDRPIGVYGVFGAPSD